MVTYLNLFGEPVKIFHFPGRRTTHRQGILDSFVGSKVTIPDNIQIITTVDNASLDKAVLIKQLKYNKVDYINSAYNKNTVYWCNRKKI